MLNRKHALKILLSAIIFVFCSGLSLQIPAQAETRHHTHKHKKQGKVIKPNHSHKKGSSHSKKKHLAHTKHLKNKIATRTVVSPQAVSVAEQAGLRKNDPLFLTASAVLVMDQTNSQTLLEKNAQIALPIASITKLMTTLVLLEKEPTLSEILEITEDDVDTLKNSHSRLPVGSRLPRVDLLHLALMSSENRAASALARNYPGGKAALVERMNAKARELGMQHSHFVEPTGLSSDNRASAYDLAKLVSAAYQYPLIRRYSTYPEQMFNVGGNVLEYRNSNALVKDPHWNVLLQKTGYISEAGRCLVMLTQIAQRPVVMVVLDSTSKTGRIQDVNRIREWLENSSKLYLSQN